MPTTTHTNLTIVGAAGRMGRRLIALSRENPAWRLVAAVDRSDHPEMGKDAGELAGIGKIGVELTSDAPLQGGVVVDFSSPASTRTWLAKARAAKCPILAGTTGLSDSDLVLVAEAAKEIPVLRSANMSLGVNLLLGVVRQMAASLGEEYDIEITESHHRFKKDAPSGTAMMLADSVLEGRGLDRSALAFNRHGADCTRKTGEVGMTSLRMGDEIGLHTVYFAAKGERIEVTHRATDRDTFVRGALKCAEWLRGQKPGLYSVRDALGL